MSKKKAYIHIGSHKTGTSSIQVALSKNHDRLLKLGFLYPSSMRFWVGHHHLPWFLLDDPAYKHHWSHESQSVIDVLQNEIESHNEADLILSSEHFFLCNSEQLRVLAQALSNRHVVIIVYLRRQDRFLESWYSHLVSYTNMEVEPISFFLERPRYNLDYKDVIEQWLRTFGHADLKVISYDECMRKNNLIETFFSAVGIDLGALDYSTIRAINLNKSLNSAGVYLLRQYNCLYKVTKNYQLLKMKRELTGRLLNQPAFTNGTHSFLSNSERMRLLERFLPGNRFIVEHYGCGSDLANVDDFRADNQGILTITADQIDKFIEEVQALSGVMHQNQAVGGSR